MPSNPSLPPYHEARPSSLHPVFASPGGIGRETGRLEAQETARRTRSRAAPGMRRTLHAHGSALGRRGAGESGVELLADEVLDLGGAAADEGLGAGRPLQGLARQAERGVGGDPVEEVGRRTGRRARVGRGAGMDAQALVQLLPVPARAARLPS